jgi:hypothetical protein
MDPEFERMISQAQARQVGAQTRVEGGAPDKFVNSLSLSTGPTPDS